MAEHPKSTSKRRGLRAVSGFLFTAFLITSLFSYHIYRLTSFEMVEKIGTTTISSMNEVQSLFKLYYSELVELAEQSPEADLVLPGFDIQLGVKLKDIKGISEDEFGNFIVRSLLKRIYYEGFSNVIKPSDLAGVDKENLRGLNDVADGFVNKKFNDFIFLVFIVSTVLAALFALPFFIFSSGWNRPAGFGTGFVVAGIPALLLLYTRSKIEGLVSSDDVAAGMLRGAILPFVDNAASNYFIVLLLGVGLLLVSASGIFITKRRKSKAL
ncbi:MAG: hypothetical protein K6T91_07160 [Firmicutes bacterium]|nr:hypothetical protein [Bacillota bacterium]